MVVTLDWILYGESGAQGSETAHEGAKTFHRGGLQPQTTIGNMEQDGRGVQAATATAVTAPLVSRCGTNINIFNENAASWREADTCRQTRLA